MIRSTPLPKSNALAPKESDAIRKHHFKLRNVGCTSKSTVHWVHPITFEIYDMKILWLEREDPDNVKDMEDEYRRRIAKFGSITKSKDDDLIMVVDMFDTPTRIRVEGVHQFYYALHHAEYIVNEFRTGNYLPSDINTSNPYHRPDNEVQHTEPMTRIKYSVCAILYLSTGKLYRHQ